MSNNNHQMVLFAQEQFQLQLENFANKAVQNWQEIIPQSAQKVMQGRQTVNAGFVGLTAVGATMATMGAFGLLTSVFSAPLFLGVEFIGGFASICLSGTELSKPARMRNAKLPAARNIKAKMDVDKAEGTVTASVYDHANNQLLETFELGQHDQEEIAKRFLMLQQLCQQINEQSLVQKAGAQQLLAVNNLTPKGKINNRKDHRVRRLGYKPQEQTIPDIDHQIQQQNKQMTVTTNQQLVKALESGQS